MNAATAYLQAQAVGMHIIADCQGMSHAALIAAGASDIEATTLLNLAATYYGPTKYTRLQREARNTTHSLSTLKLIEHYARQTKTELQGWQLRNKLCTSNIPASKIEHTAKAFLKELQAPRQVSEGTRLTRRTNKPWTISITGPSELIAEAHNALSSSTPLEDLRKLLDGTEGTRTTIVTNAVITLDQLDRIVDGDGEEITIQLTNGATLTGAQLATKMLAEHGYITLVHPMQGPVNLYRTQRLANRKQRIMAAAENPICPWPDCNHPADSAQIHHLKSWQAGGETNISNLSICCPYHNGTNDDTGPPRRGRLERIDGKITWLPPWAKR